MRQVEEGEQVDDNEQRVEYPWQDFDRPQLRQSPMAFPGVPVIIWDQRRVVVALVVAIFLRQRGIIGRLQRNGFHVAVAASEGAVIIVPSIQEANPSRVLN